MRRNLRPDDDGAVAVEFALLLPFLIALLAGMFDFALAFNAQIQLSQAAQAGARAAALQLTTDVAQDRAAGASPTLHLTPADVTVSPCSGGTASVTVTHDFDVPIPIPGVASTITMRQKAVMPCAS
jgi:Flp pilus assembly protein TadG